MQPTVIIPTYNEVENLPKLISQVFELAIPGLKILVVDDNSPDGTGELAETLRKEHGGYLEVLHRSGKLGLGTAYIQGMQKALHSGADAIAQMDADFSHPPELLKEMLVGLRDHDVAMGSRYIPGGSVDQRWPTWRRGLSAFGNLYARSILGLPVKDATGGYRMWRRATLEAMPLERVRSNGYAFQVEMTYIAYRLGFRFCELPFYFADRKWGHSKMSFRIQREAAIRVWQMLLDYRDLRA